MTELDPLLEGTETILGRDLEVGDQLYINGKLAPIVDRKLPPPTQLIVELSDGTNHDFVTVGWVEAVRVLKAPKLDKDDPEVLLAEIDELLASCFGWKSKRLAVDCGHAWESAKVHAATHPEKWSYDQTCRLYEAGQTLLLEVMSTVEVEGDEA